MKITILTLFPEFFISPLQESIIKRAQEKELVRLKIVDIRDFANDKHHTADDRPFGGGPGMVMKIEPIYKALAHVLDRDNPEEPRLPGERVILTSAKGKRFVQATAQVYAQLEHLIIICGHYEGVDERVKAHLVDEEVRIGDYVMTGGEPAALVMLDTVTRLLPGVLGNEESPKNESHSEPGMLGFPQYTRPEVFKDWAVPAILLGGNHAQIEQWREEQREKEE